MIEKDELNEVEKWFNIKMEKQKDLHCTQHVKQDKSAILKIILSGLANVLDLNRGPTVTKYSFELQTAVHTTQL